MAMRGHTIACTSARTAQPEHGTCPQSTSARTAQPEHGTSPHSISARTAQPEHGTCPQSTSAQTAQQEHGTCPQSTSARTAQPEHGTCPQSTSARTARSASRAHAICAALVKGPAVGLKSQFPEIPGSSSSPTPIGLTHDDDLESGCIGRVARSLVPVLADTSSSQRFLSALEVSSNHVHDPKAGWTVLPDAVYWRVLGQHVLPHEHSNLLAVSPIPERDGARP
eukprot:363993-Chlamydomonas_euryale.AAC.6